MIADGTRRLLGDLFLLDDLGGRALKGFALPQQVWRVREEGAARSRFEAVRGERLTAFVGRRHEIALLLDRWQQARDGEGQVVLLSGDAGIGKSRITQVLMERLQNEPHVRLRYQCSEHRTSTALHPFVQQLTHAANLDADDPIEVALSKLERLLARGSDDFARAMPLIAGLLSISTGDRYPPRGVSAGRGGGAAGALREHPAAYRRPAATAAAASGMRVGSDERTTPAGEVRP